MAGEVDAYFAEIDLADDLRKAGKTEEALAVAHFADPPGRRSHAARQRQTGPLLGERLFSYLGHGTLHRQDSGDLVGQVWRAR